MSDTLIDSYSQTNTDALAKVYLNHNERVGQAITLASAWSITSVKFYLRKHGSPTGNIYAYLHTSTGTVGTNAEPTGAPLATSDPLLIQDLTASFQLIEFTFSTPYSASAGDIVVLTGYDGGSTTTCLEIYFDSSSPSHSGNWAKIHAGTPEGASSADNSFYLYGLTPGWTGKILGVTNPAKIMGIAVANISKVMGV